MIEKFHVLAQKLSPQVSQLHSMNIHKYSSVGVQCQSQGNWFNCDEYCNLLLNIYGLTLLNFSSCR